MKPSRESLLRSKQNVFYYKKIGKPKFFPGICTTFKNFSEDSNQLIHVGDPFKYPIHDLLQAVKKAPLIFHVTAANEDYIPQINFIIRNCRWETPNKKNILAHWHLLSVERTSLDIAHVWLAIGNGIFDFIKTNKETIVEVHVSDTLSGQDLHLLPGHGKIPLEDIIREIGLDCDYLFEPKEELNENYQNFEEICWNWWCNLKLHDKIRLNL